MRTRTKLCLKQTSVAMQLQTIEVWTVMLGHHLDMMRLCSDADNGLEMSPPPFLMLRLNRDDDAYCYCRRALGRTDWADMDLTFTNDTANSRFRDAMEDVSGEQLIVTRKLPFWWPWLSSRCVWWR